MNVKNIVPEQNGILQVVVETPRGSQNKYDYDEKLDVFKIKKMLPMGMVFPFDFGFLPNTTGGDGDPLDVLVIMDEAAYPGCLVACRAVGILEATQKEKDKQPVRNDRIVAVATTSILYAEISTMADLNKNMVADIEHFFIDYNKHEGKEFVPIAWRNTITALELVRESITP
jgi:inorganic pyrophosphatase